MYPFFLHLLANGLNQHRQEEYTQATVHHHLHDTIEGSEFLDDAIRMKEQPLSYTEEAAPALQGE